MGALLDQFRAVGVRFEPAAGDNLSALGLLTDELRAAIRAHKLAILAELAAANDEVHWRLWITPTHRPAFEVRFSPEVTAEQVTALYPGARIEPLSEPHQRAATPAEADELRKLLALIFAEAGAAERAEVFAVACADAEAALTSFRLLAADLG